jgi:hypothetical protein
MNTSDKSGLVRQQRRQRKGTLTFLRGISARMVSQTSGALGNTLGENTHRA